ncbi:MAG: EF-P lysine aminoacylase GenX [Syntrophaceae bacterium]|nr:EF-P lysine aminoacylase GenX [Syntrophaceae bacterium]
MTASHFDDTHNLARKKDYLDLRAGLIQNIRLYFINHDFLEVETPLRIPAPAPEEHIEAITSAEWFLQTSPELCMKRLLAAGYPRIFQICKCFRDAERGNLHLPEFTMLEWYVSGFNYLRLMEQCENMLIEVFNKMGCAENIIWQNRNINLAPPWEKISVAEAFSRYTKISCDQAIADDKFEEIMADCVEPHLGTVRPTFIYDYPSAHSTLAKLKNDTPDIAERFELYIGSLELANGFSELVDAEEQRKRFLDTLQSRARKNWKNYPMPEKFLSSLEKIPAAAGIALGIDRLVMLLADTKCIDDVVAFTPEML